MPIPTFDAAPTNSFLQNAHKKRFLQQGVPVPEEEEGESNVANKSVASLMGKQKWKMLKNIPGKHSGNTWQMMGFLNKGMTPMNKSAEGLTIKVAKIPWGQLGKGALSMGKNFGKNTIKEVKQRPVSTVGLPLGGYYLYSQMGNKVDNIQNHLGGMGESISGAANEMGDLAREGRAAINDFRNGVKPWQDMLGGIGRGIAGTFGMQGYNRPQWQQNAFNSGQQMYNKATDPETGIVGVVNQQVQQKYQQFIEWLAQLMEKTSAMPTTASGTKEAGLTIRTPFAALQIALNGSEQFQKQASANAPDTLLKAHLSLADEMEKCAGYFLTQEIVRPFAIPFRKAADMVRQGYPAKTAMFVCLGKNEKLAAPTHQVLHRMAAEVLMREVSKTYQRKEAEQLKKKSRNAAD